MSADLKAGTVATCEVKSFGFALLCQAVSNGTKPSQKCNNTMSHYQY